MNRSGGSRYKQRVMEVFVFFFHQSRQLLFLLFYVVPITWQSRWNVSRIHEPVHRPLLETWPVRFLHFRCCNLVTQLNRGHSWGIFSSVIRPVIFQPAESNERFSFHLQDFTLGNLSNPAALQSYSFPVKANILIFSFSRACWYPLFPWGLTSYALLGSGFLFLYSFIKWPIFVVTLSWLLMRKS